MELSPVQAANGTASVEASLGHAERLSSAGSSGGWSRTTGDLGFRRENPVLASGRDLPWVSPARAVTVTQPCPGPHLSVEITLPSKPDTPDLRVFTPRQRQAKGGQKSLRSRPPGGGVSEQGPHPQLSTPPPQCPAPCALPASGERQRCPSLPAGGASC